MGVALQAGLIAAFVVVFLPLIMAGWHLTRNRLLFFSVALFITLAVSVHLSPYFASLHWILFPHYSNLAIVGSINSSRLDRCVYLLHKVTWNDGNGRVGESPMAADACSQRQFWSWTDYAFAGCGFRKVNRSDALELLQRSWIVVAGDSQARFFLVALMDFLMESIDLARGDLFKRHSDYTHILKEYDIRLDFIWAPYAANLTTFVVQLRHNHTLPDVLVMGNGLWHMLHVNNASDYFDSLLNLQKAVLSIFPVASSFNEIPELGVRPGSLVAGSTPEVPQMFWLNFPTLITVALNTEEKQQKLTREHCASYNREVANSKLLRPEGPLTLLDLEHLSHRCGPRCTMDGMHYCGAVYEAAAQMMLNALLIVTQQAPAR
eukprot:c28542_g1_i1 orf=225-1355(+)